MRPRYVKSTNIYIYIIKRPETGTGRWCSGTTNPRVTRKPDNTLKGIRNPIPHDQDNPLKGIWDLVQNRTQSQCPRGLTIPN